MKYKITMDLSGKDDVFLGKSIGYVKGFFSLDHSRNAPSNLSQEVADQALGRYRQHHEGGKNGDRIEISQRKQARAALTEFFERAVHFLHAVATEEDIPLIQQAGFEVRSSETRKRARRVARTAKPEQPTVTLAGDGGS